MTDELHPLFAGISIALMVLWGYCIWFHSKYDKDSNKLMLLLFLNFYYLPFYAFRMRRIKKAIAITNLSEDIYDSDFINDTRTSILDNLSEWADIEKKPKLDDDEIDDVENYYFQWKNLFHIERRLLEEAFTESELELLETFDNAVAKSEEKYKGKFPSFADYCKFNDSKVLEKLAKEIGKEIK